MATNGDDGEEECNGGGGRKAEAALVRPYNAVRFDDDALQSTAVTLKTRGEGSEMRGVAFGQ